MIVVTVIAGLLMWGALPDERLGLSLTIAAGPRQRNHDHILLFQIRDCPKPGGSGPRIYTPHEQGGSVIPPGTGFSQSQRYFMTGGLLQICLSWRQAP
jgi:hypothetical protein